MLARLQETGVVVDRFIGIDKSEHACAVLEAKLEAAADPGLDYEVVVVPFDSFETDERFDLVLFNHVIEYLGADAFGWIGRSRGMLRDDGSVMVFSPTRGGINQPYEETFVELTGTPPIFADDVAHLLDAGGVAYAKETMIASCDISALDRPDADPEKVMLLSFLTQRDCRGLPEVVRQRYVDHYRSLRPPGERGIAHPTTLFAI